MDKVFKSIAAATVLAGTFFAGSYVTKNEMVEKFEAQKVQEKKKEYKVSTPYVIPPQVYDVVNSLDKERKVIQTVDLTFRSF